MISHHMQAWNNRHSTTSGEVEMLRNV